MPNLLALSNFHKEKIDPTFEKGLFTFLNPYSYLRARTDIYLFSNFDQIFFDGIAVLKLFSFFGIAKSRRMSFDMTSLAHSVLSYCSQHGKSVYFIGSTDEVIEMAVAVFKTAFPGLKVAGFRHGYFRDERELQETMGAIRKIDPDVVIAGLGTPLQEQFLVGLRGEGWNGTGFTCGGFFHQTAKKGIQYYPPWIDRLNLRWAYRIYDEPKLFKRYFLYYPYFVVIFLCDVLKFYFMKLFPKRV